MQILTIDIGGSKVKILASGQSEPRRAPSGPELTPARLVELVQELAQGWDFDVVSIGYPGLCGDDGPRSEPGNLGHGWVGFDYVSAFGRPVKILNDAAMQALGSYEGGRMLFLGLGTGLGSALIADKVIIPLELGDLPYCKNRSLSDLLGRAGLKRLGRRAWQRSVARIVPALMRACAADYVVVGGGNAKHLIDLPHGVRRGHNLTAFRGGFRLWGVEDIPVQSPEGRPDDRPPASAWRLV